MPDTPVPKILITLIAILIGVEAVLQAADAGLIGSRRWRSLAYQWGAFWPGLLDNWGANYAAQPATMFLSYGFLHSGLSHIAGNALTLWVLGRAVCDRAGTTGFVLTCVFASMGGALCFAALSSGAHPMVGASGAIFGLAGLWTGWQWLDGQGHGRVAGIIGFLVVLNIALWWWHAGLLAWQAHLGGFVAGFAMAGWLGRKPRRFDRS